MTDSHISSNKRVSRARRGVSLIEVLVVLVILVTGILTIIRLFPSGFFSIQSTGNAALGDSLGVAAISAGTQDSSSLPEAILPDNMSSPTSDTLLNLTTNAAAYSNYDPDDPSNLDNARVVTNETVTIPSAASVMVNGQSIRQSIYVVKYGPVVMPTDPAAAPARLPNYFTVSSPNWTALSGNSDFTPAPGSVTPIDVPQETLVPGQERFYVDLNRRMIAVPYAPYTPLADGSTYTLSNGQVVRNAVSYEQKMVLVINCQNIATGAISSYTKYLDFPAATPRNMTNPYAPATPTGSIGTYIADTPSNYQGGWIDPTMLYQDTSSGPSGANPPPTGVQWISATLSRSYNGVVSGHDFNNAADQTNNDPYQFKLAAANVGTANPGSVSFNPKAAGGVGGQARKARISYIAFSWQILHEDYDIPSLTGTGSTSVIRTTVPNLLLAGSANPDNTINPGIAGGSSSLVVLDLDTGQLVAPFSAPYDPTTPDKPINNEDVNGPLSDPNSINVSYALGRLTFGSNAFADNTKPDGSGTAPAHRIRVFYTADLNWTVAVQKAPAYFSQVVPSGGVTDTTALAANQFAFDQTGSTVYFARCNAGKTVEIDGFSPVAKNGVTTQTPFTTTIAVSPILNDVGAPDVQVVGLPATATITAVRGLSARAVVAWKERNQWKVHSVDAVLNRTP